MNKSLKLEWDPLCDPASLPTKLTPREFADFTRHGLSTVYAWLRSGLLPAERIGRSYRIDRSIALRGLAGGR
jgi:excisionase family DNA binding protein